MAALSTLTLHFNVTGAAVAVANVRNMTQGIANAAHSLEASWSRMANTMEHSLYRVTNRLTTIASIGAGIFTAGVYKMTSALAGLGAASVRVNQQFQEFEITLASSLKSAESARKITQEVAKITAYSPIPFKDIASTITGMSVLPQLNARYVQQAQDNKLGDVNGLLRRSIRLIEMMTTFRPDKNPDEALFSIREALNGEFRSIQRRFDVPLSIFTNASGMSMGKLKEKGPDAIFDALFKAFDNIVSSASIAAKAKLPTVTLENLWEQIFQQPSIAVGRQGWDKTLNEQLNKWLQRATFFFTENPEVKGSGKFVTGGMAEKISTAVTKTFYRVVDAMTNGIDKLLIAIGAEGNGMFERASDALSKGFTYVSSNFPKWLEYARTVFEQLWEVSKIIGGYVVEILKFFGDKPKLTAALALAGPGNVVRLGFSAATGAAALAMRGGANLVGAYSGAADAVLASANARGMLRISPQGAQQLAAAGVTTAAGGAYRGGQLVSALGPTGTALAGIAGAAAVRDTIGGFLRMAGVITTVVLALGALSAAIISGIDTWESLKRDKGISGGATAAMTSMGDAALAQYRGTPAGDAAISSTSSLTRLMSRVSGASSIERRSEAYKADQAMLFSVLGVPTETQAIGVGSKGGGVIREVANVDGQKLPFDEELWGILSKRVADYKRLMLERVIADTGKKFVPASEIEAGNIRARDAALTNSEFDGAYDMLEKKFGMGKFKANVASTGQLSSSRLMSANLDFLDKFAANLDPNATLQKDVEAFDRTLAQVKKNAEANVKMLETLSDADLHGYVQKLVDEIEAQIGAGATTYDMSNGRRIDIQERLKQLRGYQSGMLGTKKGLTQEHLTSVSNAESLNAQGKSVALLKFYTSFADGVSKNTYGPEFSSNLARFSEGLGAIAKGDHPFPVDTFERLNKMAESLHLDTSQMNEYEKLQAISAQKDTFAAMFTEITKNVSYAAQSSDEISTLHQSMVADYVKGAQLSAEARKQVEAMVYGVSLDSADSSSRMNLQLLAAADAKGYRTSTDSRMNAAANSALTGAYGPMDGMTAGFESQFKTGSDFMNMAREGIEIAQQMKQAFGDAFSNIVIGAESVGAAFKNMAVSILQAMARIFAQKAASMLLSYVFNTPNFGSTATPAVANGQGYVPATYTGLASGGYIAQGRGGIDDVPSMLMRGEYVLNERAVRAIGVNNLNRWNSGSIRSFAEGGAVSPYSSSSMGADTIGNRFDLGDVHYHAGGKQGDAGGGLTAQDMQDFRREHKAMTIALLEEHERRKMRMGR